MKGLIFRSINQSVPNKNVRWLSVAQFDDAANKMEIGKKTLPRKLMVRVRSQYSSAKGKKGVVAIGNDKSRR